MDDAIANARLLFVSVGTPPTYSGDADLSAVLAVAESMPASSGHALVMKSTVPCGTGRAISRLLAEQGKQGLAYVSCPGVPPRGLPRSPTSAPPTGSWSAMTAPTTAYSIGSSLTSGSMNPLTIRVEASASERPRLLR